MVAHGHGLTLAPWEVRDTFGIAQVGELAHVRVDTPSGPVWTDNKGYAVVPSLNSWKRSVVTVDTRSLSKNTDVVNGMRELSMARGAVSEIRFATLTSRRVLVRVVDGKGQRLPGSALVTDASDTLITLVDEDGTILIPDAKPQQILFIAMPYGRCRLLLENLPEKPPRDNIVYEKTDGVCWEV